MRAHFGRLGTRIHSGVRRLFGARPRPARDSAWFDHPEMQERIARAEADLREGRYFTANSVEEMLEYLNSPRKPAR